MPQEGEQLFADAGHAFAHLFFYFPVKREQICVKLMQFSFCWKLFFVTSPNGESFIRTRY